MPDIVITPNRGTTSNPKIDFTGVTTGTIKLEVLADGTIAWNGANGSLFSIADSLSGSLMSVNDISGLPAFEVFSDNRVVVGQFGANLLLGKTTNSSNGRLQLASHTTSAGGIGFGTDVGLFRSDSQALGIAHIGGTNPLFHLIEGTTKRLQIGTNSGDAYFDTLTAGKSLYFRSGNQTLALTLDSSQNATFASRITANGATIASAGSIQVTSADAALRLKSTTSPVADKNTWDIRSVGNGATPYLQFRTVNDANTVFTDRVAFTNDGNVGIGTSAPTSKLSVVTGGIEISGTANANTYLLEVKGTAASGGFLPYGNNVQSKSYWGTSNALTVGSAYFATAPSDGSAIFSGSVGVGTTSPAVKLEVNSGVSSEGLRLTATTASSTMRFVDNAGTSYNNFIGASTLGAGDVGLIFQTGNGSANTRMVINTTGNIGIGTTAPNAKLNIAGASGGGLNLLSLQPSDSTSAANQIVWSRSDNWTPASIGQVYSSGVNYGGHLVFSTHADDGVAGNQSSPIERMRILANGNVGIGTTSPSPYKLSVDQGAVVQYPINLVSSGKFIRMGALNASYAHVDTDAASGFYFYDQVETGSGNSRLGLSSQSTYFALNGGNVGIGTTSPSQKLEVGNFLDAVTNKITVSARYEYEPEFNFRLGQSGTGYDWIGAVISSGDDGNYNGKISFKTANGSRDTPTTKMVIKASGNVGIGTTTPKGVLDLNFASYANPVGLTDVSIGALRMSGNGGLTAISSRQFDSINQPAGGDIQFLNLYYNGSTYNWYETMRVRANGNVGIGTASPTNPLEVNGIIYSNKTTATGFYARNTTSGAASTLELQSTGTGGADWILATGNSAYGGANEDFNVYKNAAGTGSEGSKFTIKASGTVSIPSTTAGSAGAGALVITGGLSAGNNGGASYFGGNVILPAAYELRFGAGGNDRIYQSATSGGSLILDAGGVTRLTLNSTAATFAGAVSISAGTLTATNTAATQGIFKGWNSRSGANADNGQIDVGGATGLRLMSDASGTGGSVVDDRWDNAASSLTFRLRGNGTPVTSLTLNSTTATFAGAVTSTGLVNANATVRVKGTNLSDTTSTLVLDHASPVSRLISYGSSTAQQGTFNFLSLSSNGSLNTTSLGLSPTLAAFPASVSIAGTTAGSAGAGALVVSGGLATGAASYFGGAVTVTTPDGVSASFTNATDNNWSAKFIKSGGNELQLSGNITANSGPSIRAVTSGGAGYAPLTVDGSTFTAKISGVSALSISAASAATFAGSSLTLAPAAAEAIITAKGRATGTNPFATTSRGGVLALTNLNTTDNNAEAITFQNSNDLAVASIVAQNVSHTGRTGKLYFNVSNGAAPAEAFSIAPNLAATFAGAVNGTTAAFSGAVTHAKGTSTVSSGSVSVMAGTLAGSGILQEWKTNTNTQRAYIGNADQVVIGGVVADFAIDATSGNLILSTAQTTRATISSTGVTFAGAVTVSGTGTSSIAGNVGIGTTSPSSKLDVNGVVKDQYGDLRTLPENAKTAAYVLAASDTGRLINITTGGITVNSGIFSVGQAVTIYNNSAANQTITQGTSVTMYLAGSATTGNRTLAQRGLASVICVAANTFVISGSGLT